jgi:hypothetical protein
MRMQIVQAKFIEQCLLHNLVREQEGLDPDGLHQPPKRTGKMAVDEHRMAVLAVAGDVGNVVIAVDYAHALTNGLDRVEQNTILDVLGLVPDFPLALHRASPPSEARRLALTSELSGAASPRPYLHAARLLELLGHAEMFLEMGQRVRRPALELGTIPAFGVSLEQRDRIPVRLELDLIVTLVEILAALRL